MIGDAPFLGRGWGFPISFGDDGSDVVQVAGSELVRQRIQIILSTLPNERPLREHCGCDLASSHPKSRLFVARFGV